MSKINKKPKKDESFGYNKTLARLNKKELNLDYSLHLGKQNNDISKDDIEKKTDRPKSGKKRRERIFFVFISQVFDRRDLNAFKGLPMKLVEAYKQVAFSYGKEVLDICVDLRMTLYRVIFFMIKIKYRGFSTLSKEETKNVVKIFDYKPVKFVVPDHIPQLDDKMMFEDEDSKPKKEIKGL